MRGVLIGGNGGMGQWFRTILEKHAIEYEVVDKGTNVPVLEAVRRCDLVVVSVPISVTAQVIQEFASELTPEHLLVDLTSVKQGLVAAWSSLQCEILSLHPMFGPSVESNEGQNLVVVPVREGEKASKLRKILSSENFQVSECSPEEHDSHTAVTQVATSLTAMLFASSIGLMGCNDGTGYASLRTPNFEILWAAAARILSSDPKLYAEIAGFNSHALSVVEQIQQVLNEISVCLRSRDTEQLAELYANIAKAVPESEIKRGEQMSRELVRCVAHRNNK